MPPLPMEMGLFRHADRPAALRRACAVIKGHIYIFLKYGIILKIYGKANGK